MQQDQKSITFPTYFTRPKSEEAKEKTQNTAAILAM